MSQDFDVIIVGTGAGGGTLAHTLAATGKRILLLELGSRAGIRRRPVHIVRYLV